MSWGKVGIFAGGVLFGTAGLRILTSKDAKKVYTHCTAAVLRAKDAVVDEATLLQENCTDIYEEAKQINEERASRDVEEVVEDLPKSTRGRGTAKKENKASGRRSAEK